MYGCSPEGTWLASIMPDSVLSTCFRHAFDMLRHGVKQLRERGTIFVGIMGAAITAARQSRGFKVGS